MLLPSLCALLSGGMSVFENGGIASDIAPLVFLGLVVGIGGAVLIWAAIKVRRGQVRPSNPRRFPDKIQSTNWQRTHCFLAFFAYIAPQRAGCPVEMAGLPFWAASARFQSSSVVSRRGPGPTGEIALNPLFERKEAHS